jgi:hypothetical protein
MTNPVNQDYVRQIRADRAHGGPMKSADQRAREAVMALQAGRPSAFSDRLGHAPDERVRAVAALHRLYRRDDSAQQVLDEWPEWVPQVVYADVPRKTKTQR